MLASKDGHLYELESTLKVTQKELGNVQAALLLANEDKHVRIYVHSVHMYHIANIIPRVYIM